jgi:universal stress protein A
MTENITRILVPVDFSPHADRALGYATGLAAKLGATLTFVHVVEDPITSGPWSSDIYIPNLPELRDDLVKRAGQRLDELTAAAGASGVAVTAAVLMGQAGQAIVDYAGSGGFDLIVMGTHGRTGVSHLLLGSVAERVMRGAPCPVLTIKGTAQPEAAAAHAAA